MVVVVVGVVGVAATALIGAQLASKSLANLFVLWKLFEINILGIFFCLQIICYGVEDEWKMTSAALDLSAKKSIERD